MTGLRIVPVFFDAACSFVTEHHRHLPSPQGHLFSVGLATGDELVGVAMVGLPVARLSADGGTAEVRRCCVADGVPNGCSMLYGACWRAARALGWQRLITFTQAGEPGTSLRAAGWRVLAERRAHAGWSRPGRVRHTAGAVNVQRTLWEVASR